MNLVLFRVKQLLVQATRTSDLAITGSFLDLMSHHQDPCVWA